MKELHPDRELKSDCCNASVYWSCNEQFDDYDGKPGLWCYTCKMCFFLCEVIDVKTGEELEY